MSVTAARGFAAAGVAAGIKPAGDLDVAMVVAIEGTVGAALFTTNRAAAPPVAVSRRHLAAGSSTRAIVLNSGCANAGTGRAGEAVATETAAVAASLVGCAVDEVIVCSTGPIGLRLDAVVMGHGVRLAMAALATGEEAAGAAARAIMTTDSVPKEAVSHGDGFTVGGMAKGAGMIRPDMATMLAVITTDAAVDPSDLAVALRRAVDDSFNCLDVDGCESTNDTVVALASGASGRRIATAELADPLGDVCRTLAHNIAADAEGASRVVRLAVWGAADAAAARTLGKAVADSALVRSSFFGGDPNWGRVLAALGAAPVAVDPGSVTIAYEGVVVAGGGVASGADLDGVAARLALGDFTLAIAVGDGPGSAEILTTDLTPDYVRFNGERS